MKKSTFSIEIKNYPSKKLFCRIVSTGICKTKHLSKSKKTPFFFKFPKCTSYTDSIPLIATIYDENGFFLFEFTTTWRYDGANKNFSVGYNSFMPKLPFIGFNENDIVVHNLGDGSFELTLTAINRPYKGI